MKFHLFKRSVAQEIAEDLDATVRHRREALDNVEYWGAMHDMLSERERRLRQELAEQAGTQTLPMRVEYAVSKPPLDKRWLLVAALVAFFVAFLLLPGSRP